MRSGGVYNNGHSHQTTHIRQLIVVVAIAVCVCVGGCSGQHIHLLSTTGRLAVVESKVEADTKAN